MPRYIILKTVSTCYELEIEADNPEQAIYKAHKNQYDVADVCSQSDGDVYEVELQGEV